MSVLNQSGEEQVECPLCMEPLEVDDLNFYPCTCGYQICRFCWHRIRTDENGLCPACRKAYSENPADFTPLSKEQVAQLKAEKRQRDQQRKAKLSESRKHLASVRVVQKNLVFVVGLPVRLADPDVLKRHEYFGKFGKIHKVVINQSTAYAGAQGPSASAYVTYVKSEDALRAIQNVNNIVLDGRMIKTSLGTTKYCSHFMKNQPCPKADCMYLHDFGDLEASFTKEQMHMGKHQEYEKKLHEALLNRTTQQQNQPQPGTSNNHSTNTDKQHISTVTSQRDRPGDTNTANNNHNTNTNGSSSSANGNSHDGGRNHSKTGNAQNGKDSNSWPTLSNNSTTTDTATTTTNSTSTTSSNIYTNHKSEKQKSESKSERVQKKNNQKNKNNNNSSITNNNIENSKKNEKLSKLSCEQNNCQSQHSLKQQQQQQEQMNQQTIQSQIHLEQSQQLNSVNQQQSHIPTTEKQQKHIKELTDTTSNSNSQNQILTSECIESLSKIHIMDDNSSFFSHNTFQKIVPEQDSSSYSTDSSSVTPHSNILNDSLPDINSSEDWQAAFGFTNSKRDSPQIDLLNATNRTLTENGLSNYPPTNYDTNRQQNCYNKYDVENVPFKLLDLPNERSLNSNNTYINMNQKLPDNGLNGLDQHMSKFFAEFHKQNQQKDIIYNEYNNGFVQSINDRQNFLSNQIGLNDNQQMLLLNQYHQRVLDKHLEDQALYNLKHNIYQQHQQQQQQQQQYLQNHATTLHHNDSQQFITNGGDHYLQNNGQNFANVGYQGSVFQNQTLQRGQAPLRDRSTVDDELGFDPFHETQKALAELIESEQSVSQLQNNGLLGQTGGMSSHGSGLGSGAPVNGLIHGTVTTTSTSHLPPPPGFMQHNAHMNSFGSKILPFLNMSSSQQISNSGGWSNNYSEAHLKGLASVNDWTTLDPAIVSSSRHFPLATLQSLRDQYNSPFQQQQNGPMRAAYDFTQTNGYANNYSQQQQHNMQTYTNNYNTLQNSLNWYANNDIHNQISSPPGFRTATSNTKTQEC